MVTALLEGYYGKGNFGDDVLFCVTCELLRQHWPDCEFFVKSAAPLPPYLHRLVGPVQQPPRHDQRYDLIVHGGGGTFFDFSHGTLLDRIANRGVLFARGRPYGFIERLVRRILGRQRDSATVRLGWGIGVGSFERSSPTLRHRIPTLLDFDGLMLRDKSSLANLEALGLAGGIEVEVGSDIAFLHDCWWRPKPLEKQPERRRRVGVVLRDWPPGAGGPHVSRRLLAEIEPISSDYELTYFVFDRSADGDTLQQLGDRKVVVWDPDTCRIDEFSTRISAMDFLVTTRAHGGICGAVVGVPSVLIEIEPKLRTVHEMLPNSSQLLASDTDTFRLRAALAELRAMDAGGLAADVERNRRRARAGVDRLLAYATRELDRRRPAEGAMDLQKTI